MSAPGPSGSHRPSRRLVVVGAAVVLAGGVGAAVATTWRDDPQRQAPGDEPGEAPAPAPSRRPGGGRSAALAAVLVEADATAGLRLLRSPWARWAGRPDGSGGSGGADGSDATGWDGLYVSWLLRRHGGDPAATAPADLLALVGERGQVGVAPVPGALVFYGRDPARSSTRGGEPARVGLVTSVTGAALAQTLEGDHPASLPHHERFVRRLARPGPGPLLFALPAYPPDEPDPDPDPSEDR